MSNCSSSETFRRLPPGSIDLATLCSAVGRRSRLVRIEKRVRRPAPEHPAQLPAQVEPVGNGGVHSGATARSHRWAASPMRNALPDRKRSAMGRREAEYVLIDDAYGKVWDAGAGPDPDDELILTEIGHAFGSRIPAEAVKPAVS